MLLGTVTRAHGLRGEVKVRPLTESPASFARYQHLYLSTAGDGEKVPHTALQARVAVLSWAQTGPGQVGARIAGALYNDGSGGLGTPPDVPGTSSQVGDVIAQISMTGADVSYAVTRCNVAVCADATGAGITFLKERTSLGAVALGEEHVLRISWDDVAREVSFQLDDRPPVTFDPVAAGSAVAGPPGRPYSQVGTHAGAAGPGVDFSSASSGQIHAVFKDVRKL